MTEVGVRVLIDARIARRRATGAATHVVGLIAALQAVDGVQVRVVHGPPGLPRRNIATTAGNLLIDLAWTHLALPVLALVHRAQVLHAPFNWAPVVAPCPVVVTIHDLAWERVPQTFPGYFRRYARLFTKLSARRAARVICDSQATADDLAQLYRIPEEAMRVIPVGIAVDTEPVDGPREPFVLAVGEMEPRKRILELVAAHRRYFDGAAPQPPPCRLVIVGAGGSHESAVRAAVGPQATMTGRVSDEQLRQLYRTATLLVFPSSYEGFGLPVLEAMAHGCPALVAQNSSLREISGEVAIPLDDPSVEGIATALTRVLADRAALAARGERSRRHAATYSWDRVADATVALYRETIQS